MKKNKNNKAYVRFDTVKYRQGLPEKNAAAPVFLIETWHRKTDRMVGKTSPFD